MTPARKQAAEALAQAKPAVFRTDRADAPEVGDPLHGQATTDLAIVGKWDYGWIYDPDKDPRCEVEITVLRNGKLKILGYAGTKWFSETMFWTRAPADLKLCNA